MPLALAPTPPATRRRPARLRLTGRDRATLRWIADQDAVRADVIAHLLGGADPLTRNGARQVIDRWRHAGLVEQERLLGRGAPTCWLTNRGLRLVGTRYRARRPSLGRLEHLHAVGLVRLGVERRGGRSWTSERALQRARDRPDAHLADGRFVAPSGAVTAVEVELTLKESRRLHGIVDDLTIEYPAVLYVVRDRRVRRAVEGAVDALGEHRRVAVVDLEPFLLHPT